MPLFFDPSLVPPVGRIFGIRVHVDTLGDLERRLGKGTPMMGGHSGGARVWYDRRRGWALYADGFEYAVHGRVPREIVEDLHLTARTIQESSQRVAKLKQVADYGAFTTIRPGMQRFEVHAALKGLAGKWEGDTFVQSGRATVRHMTNDEVERLTSWRAEFLFDNGHLSVVELSSR